MSFTFSPGETASSRGWLALGTIAVAEFIVIMDVSIIGVALPQMQVDLGFTPEQDHDLFLARLTGGLARDRQPGLDRKGRASDTRSGIPPGGTTLRIDTQEVST